MIQASTSHRLWLTVQSAPSSDVAGVEVGQQSPCSRKASQLDLLPQRHRLRQLDEGDIVAERQQGDCSWMAISMMRKWEKRATPTIRIHSCSFSPNKLYFSAWILIKPSDCFLLTQKQQRWGSISHARRSFRAEWPWNRPPPPPGCVCPQTPCRRT